MTAITPELVRPLPAFARNPFGPLATLVRRRLVSEYDHVETEPCSRRKEAVNDGVGWLGSDEVKPHQDLQLS